MSISPGLRCSFWYAQFLAMTARRVAPLGVRGAQDAESATHINSKFSIQKQLVHVWRGIAPTLNIPVSFK